MKHDSRPVMPAAAPLLHAGNLKAVIFDIDGTLYPQGPVRRAMLVRLLALLAAHPRRGWQTIRVLRAYRRAQETLRFNPGSEGVASAQIRLASERSHVDAGTVARVVTQWMEEEPLALLPRYMPSGVMPLLAACRARGLRLGALSDYPADAKLHALGLSDLFDVVLCAQAPAVNAFKPDPRGLLTTLERLGATAAECLYVGDRVDVDAATAHAAGVRCAILTRRPTRDPRWTYVPVESHTRLHELLWPQEVRI